MSFAFASWSTFAALIVSSCGPFPGINCVFSGKSCEADGTVNSEKSPPKWLRTFVRDLDDYPKGQRRLAPEQLSSALQLTAGVDCGIGSRTERYECTLIDYLAVPLGGVDFAVARERDEVTKINTLLFGREEMDDKANKISGVNRDVPEGDYWYDEKNFWSEADPRNSDHAPPLTETDEETSGNLAWSAQLDKIFWTYLSRPPSTAERTLLAKSFLAARDDPGWRNPIGAWQELLYIIFMSEEFWHI